MRDVRLVGLLVPIVAGCVTETGNPEFEPKRELSALARTSEPDRIEIGTTDASSDLSISEAFVTLREIRLESAERCDEAGTTEAEIEGPWTVDLVGPPDALPVTLEDTGYCRLRLRLDPADGGPFDDRSVVLSGVRADGVPFRIESRRNEEFELRSRGEPFHLDPTGAGLLLAFDVATWLTDVGIEALAPDADGQIAIDDDDNTDALARFEGAIERAIDLFEDRDGDRAPDPDDDPLASGS